MGDSDTAHDEQATCDHENTWDKEAPIGGGETITLTTICMDCNAEL